MSNHCYQRIEISDISEDSKTKIIDWLKTYDDFDNITDWVNSIISEDNQITKSDDGYSYGSRWFEFTIEDENDFLVVSGDSAWSPLTGLCEVLSKEFQCEITIDFQECGCDFGGQWHYSKDEKSINFNGTYWEYIYWSDGLEPLILELDSIDDVDDLEERGNEFLGIVNDFDGDPEELTNHIQELKSKLCEPENKKK